MGAAGARASDLPSLWAERVKCAVAVEYVTQTELERRPTVAFGTVIDSEGTIILPSAAIDLRVSPSQMKDFKVYTPGDPEGAPAEYLGRDAFTGWHFVRASASVRGRLVPVTAFSGPGAPREAGLAEEVWGIGIRNKDEDFMPYILKSHVALLQSLPQRTAIAQQEVSGPGLPVFDQEGGFMGIGSSSFGQTFLEFTGSDRGGTPIMLVNVEESSAFVTAGEVIPYVGRVPKNPFGRPLAWLGRVRARAHGPRGGRVPEARVAVGRRRERGARGKPRREGGPEGARHHPRGRRDAAAAVQARPGRRGLRGAADLRARPQAGP